MEQIDTESASICEERSLEFSNCKVSLTTLYWKSSDFVELTQKENVIWLDLGSNGLDEIGLWQFGDKSGPSPLNVCGGLAADTVISIRLPPGLKRSIRCYFDNDDFFSAIRPQNGPIGPDFFAQQHRRDRRVRQILEAIANEIASPRFASDLAIDGYALLLKSEVARAMHASHSHHDGYKLTQKQLGTLRDIIQKEMHTRIALDRLASAVGLSRRHLSRSFKDTMGLTLREFLEAERLRRTCELLQETNLPLKAIAYHVGLANASSLSTAFTRWKSMSPSEYRKAMA